MLTGVMPTKLEGQEQRPSLKRPQSLSSSERSSSAIRLSQELSESMQKINLDPARTSLLNAFAHYGQRYNESSQTLRKQLVSAYEDVKSRLVGQPLKIEHVFLLVDPSVANYPFESLTMFQAQSEHYQSFSRIPTLKWLLRQERMKTSRDSLSGLCVVDPYNELQDTQDDFKQAKQTIKFLDWVLGKVPEGSEILKHFRESTFYIYNGHNSGEQLFHQVLKHSFSLSLNNEKVKPCVILNGCCSMRFDISNQRNTQPKNHVLSSLMKSGCSFLHGCTWTTLSSILDTQCLKLLYELDKLSNTSSSIITSQRAKATRQSARDQKKQKSQQELPQATSQVDIIKLLKNCEKLMVEEKYKQIKDRLQLFGYNQVSYGLPAFVLN
ncbi:hypothetical protein FGO68_gene3622 [Halteria grandinella]|uniref:separase n=1 Tax=Halteria grandinella TaxID=5974 RepID=A0A8J8TAL6_HALGN|nr:hypothetical protein FGO68_gene3622 [Halteria grandinella]